MPATEQQVQSLCRVLVGDAPAPDGSLEAYLAAIPRLDSLKDLPSGTAVLIRGAGAFSGPARLTKALQIDRTQNGCAASIETGLWIEDHGVRVRKSAIHKTPRIGVDYAGIWAAKPYRFVLTNPQA